MILTLSISFGGYSARPNRLRVSRVCRAYELSHVLCNILCCSTFCCTCPSSLIQKCSENSCSRRLKLTFAGPPALQYQSDPEARSDVKDARCSAACVNPVRPQLSVDAPRLILPTVLLVSVCESDELVQQRQRGSLW